MCSGGVQEYLGYPLPQISPRVRYTKHCLPFLPRLTKDGLLFEVGLRFFTLYTEKVPLRWSVGRSVGWSLRKVLVAERCAVSNTLENRKKDAICYCFCCPVGNGWAYEHTHTHAKHPKDTSLCIFLQASPVSQFGIGKQTPIVRIPVLSQKGWQNLHH